MKGKLGNSVKMVVELWEEKIENLMKGDELR